MSGMSVLNLYRLQKIDSRRDLVSSRLAEIDKIMSENEILRQSRERSETAKHAHQEALRNLKMLEDAVQSQQIKIEENNAALYGGRIHNPKELQDLQNDITSLKKHLTTLEDQQLEAMIALESLEAQFNAAQDDLKAVIAQSISTNSTLVGEQTSLRKELDRLETEHQAVVASISPDSLKLYERLRQQKRGLAVTTAKDASCDACGATLTPAEWQVARSPGQMSYCPSCGRILYAG
jgi:predicted  nucleic acid-binding Zn-ribbon protein